MDVKFDLVKQYLHDLIHGLNEMGSNSRKIPC